MMRLRTWILVGALTAWVASPGTVNAQIRNLAVTSAAGFEQGLPAPGSIASLFCLGLEGIPPLTSFSSFPLPRRLAGVRVMVSGIAAPLYAVADLGRYQQINFQVPSEIAPGNPVEVIVEYGHEQGAVAVERLDSSPGEFFLLDNGEPAIQHANYDVVSATQPVRPGEIVVAYLTGLRATVPAVPTGEPAPFEPLAVVPQVVEVAIADYHRVRVGSIAVEPSYLGLAPGLAGVYQANFVVPPVVPDGPTEIQLFRHVCTAFFGSCQAGGGLRMAYASQPVIIPVRR